MQTVAASVLSPLTPRELEVLALMAEGGTNRSIGRSLFLSQRTVEVHIANLTAKLRLPNDSGLNRRVMAVVAYLRAQDAA